MALADFATEKWMDALAVLDEAPQTSNAQVLACSYLRGQVEDAQGRTTDAKRDLSAAFTGEPKNESYGLELGLFFIRQRAYTQAVDVFAEAAKLNSSSPFLLLGLSLSEFLGGQREQSIEALKGLLAMQPRFAPAQLLMAFTLFMDGKLEDAERYAGGSLDSAHPSPYLYYLDASILVKLQSKQYDRIFRELHIAHRGIPSCGLCYLAESKAHESQGDVAAAIADLETAVRSDPDFPEALYRLASLYRRAGRQADSSGALNHFLKIKADKDERETRMLRENFPQSLDGSGRTQ